MPTKLSVFNEALRILAQPPLANSDVNLEEGRQLRSAWDSSVGAAFEGADWEWLKRRLKLGQSATPPAFGYQYYYELPGDFARVVQISSTGRPDDDEILYSLEDGKIATDASAIYLVYITNDLTSLEIGKWSQTFADFVSADLAVRTAPKLNSSALQVASQLLAERSANATSRNSIKQPPARRHPGSFVRSLRGYTYSREQG